MSSLSSSASRSARDAGAALSRASRRAVMAAAVALGATLLIGAPAHAAPSVGQQAPDFAAVDTRGTPHKLSDFAGKFVVLEWTDPGCPFVCEHYGSGHMPASQKAAAIQGVVWLSINSTERTASDYLKPAALDDWMKQNAAVPTAMLMDENGLIGEAYGARTTPQVFIIDPKGVLVYAGGIDGHPSAGPNGTRTVPNDVNRALGEALGGRPTTAASTATCGGPSKHQT